MAMLTGSNVAVILAGGVGERFWPLSTASRPKQLLNLTNPTRTLLSEAVHRAEPLFGRSRMFIATGPRIGAALAHSGLLDPEHTFIEPAPKNTLGAICWAAAQLRTRGFRDDTVMAVLTADHAIGNEEVFRDALAEAVGLARSTNGLVTIGIPPTRPETGYGYIRTGDKVEGGFRIGAFVEKPNLDLAASYLAAGGYLWNSGMFFWTLGAFRSELEAHVPEAARIMASLPDDARAFERMPAAPIDRALMERSSIGYVVEGKFPWDDVGAWDALARIRNANDEGNVEEGEIASIDTTGCIFYSDGPPIGAISVSDLIVVATASGVLVCRKDQAQRVRELLPLLHQSRTS